MSINVAARKELLKRAKEDLREITKLLFDNGYDLLGTFYKSSYFGRKSSLENAYRFHLTVLDRHNKFFPYAFTKELYTLITGYFKQPKRLGIKYFTQGGYLQIDDLDRISDFCAQVIANALDDSIRPISTFINRVHISFTKGN